jgi:opacity protein-like surface antigen
MRMAQPTAATGISTCMNTPFRICAILALIMALVVPAQAAFGQSRGFSPFEFTLGAVYQQSEDAAGTESSNLELEDTLGLNVGFDYNFNSHFSAGFDLSWLRPRFNATLIPEDDPEMPVRVSNKASMINGNFNATAYLLKGPLTPYVQGGLGWTYFDSNVVDGPPVTGCWWDPFWGFICADFYSTYRETKFSYGGTLGVRWDVTDSIFIKGGYRWLAVDTDGLNGRPVLGNALLQAGWKF